MNSTLTFFPVLNPAQHSDLDRIEMTHSAANEHQSNNFDGLRLLLALCVIWGHQDASKQWAADAAVLAFFVLSGFLVSTSWFSDPDLWRFFLRRFLRIWPALALVVVVSAGASYCLASGPMADIERLASVFYLRNLWLHVFDWSFFAWRPAGMNGSIWTLPFEADLYAALAVLGLLGRRLFFVVAALLWISAFFVAPISAVQSSLGSAWSLYFAGFFFAGAALSHWRQWLTPKVVMSVALGGAAVTIFGNSDAGRLILIPVVAAGIGVRSWPGLRSLSKFGDLSYGAYVWAWPVQQVTRLWFPSSQPVWLQLLVVIPQVLVCAFVSWHVVEKRALRWKPRIPASGSTGRPAAWAFLKLPSLSGFRAIGRLAPRKGDAKAGSTDES
jgi:peptidoglycan/LPS O-acetylase OafA/YrhL